MLVDASPCDKEHKRCSFQQSNVRNLNVSLQRNYLHDLRSTMIRMECCDDRLSFELVQQGRELLEAVLISHHLVIKVDLRDLMHLNDFPLQCSCLHVAVNSDLGLNDINDHMLWKHRSISHDKLLVDLSHIDLPTSNFERLEIVEISL
ncbi:CLUMA_CG002011, isoform A [Clunio marinus]|uniref:CLUMA_CG002011, isoform A n=1 Tax=Clunio marinus TaxID=568069 RepID=A0A1J1HP28_9DIPT|nr:CLUMA_CG002011, isoform A [Clunio marinus]